ncbi:DHA2 family efflux MFS transporter permease subunit [Actinocorallia longicatena]|uniref:DHA2 family efflux MFS transporter permease subunit n=1 Tax=Actinocorallia longicatena TaxID=111803 RepID=A0ABP6Q869_9ACTN
MTSLIRRWHGNPWAILITLSLGFFMTLLDLTIVNIAVPSMSEHLDAGIDEVLWVINGYVLILAVMLITTGRLGDMRGQRKMFMLGVAVFTVASLLCGLSQEAWQLIAARVLQGGGAALLMPQTMALIIATFPAERRGAAMGVWGSVAGLSTVAGPTLGGLLVTAFDWRWIFFVNVPIGVLVLVMAWAFIPDVRHNRQHKLDWTGVALVTVALFFLAFALTEGQRYEWNGWILASLALSAVVFAAFVLQQRSRQDNEPLVPFSLFRQRNFTVLSMVGLAVSIGMIGLFLPISIYLQSVLGFSAIKAGLVLAPSSLVSMFVAPFAGKLSDKLGGRNILIFGMTVYAVAMAWLLAVFSVDADWTAFLGPFLVSGLGIGCVFAPMATEAMRGVAPAQAGAASGVNNTIRQIGSVLGGTVAGAILQSQMAASLAEEAQKRAGALPEQVRQPFVAGIKDAAKGGLEIGGQRTAEAPAGVPADVAAQIQKIGHDVFTHAFVTAVRPTMLFPIIVMLVGAAACLLVRDSGAKSVQPAEKVAP